MQKPLSKAVLYEKGFNASAKSIDSGQPTQFAQADPSRYFLISADFLDANVMLM